MTAEGFEQAFREAGLGDDPELVLDDDPIRTGRDGLGVRVGGGQRELVLWPGVGAVRVAAYVDGEPAMVTGEAGTRRVADRVMLAAHLAEAEHGGAHVNGSRRAWLRLLEAGLAQLEGRRPRAWAVGLPAAVDKRSAEYVCFPLVRAGLDSMLLAHRSRGKTTLVLALELSLLTGSELVPGLPPVGPVDAVIHVNYENGAELVHESMRSVVDGYEGRFDILDRWAVVGQGGTPRLDRLAELVADVVAAAFPDATNLLLDVDSAEAAIATLGSDGNGDSWGARASALFNAYADVRRLLPGVVVSTLTTDHGDARNPGLYDEVETFERIGAYGSRRKLDLARAVHTLGVFGSREEAASSAIVRELMIGTAKPWPDRPISEPIAIEAWHDSDTGRLAYQRGKRRQRNYPDGIMAGSRGAQLIDLMREARIDDDRIWWTVPELVAALEPSRRAGPRPDRRVHETLRRHRRVFVSGAEGWRLSGSVP